MKTKRPHGQALIDHTGNPWWRDAILQELRMSIPSGARFHAEVDGKVPDEVPLLEGDVPIDIILLCLHRCCLELHRQAQEINPWLELYALGPKSDKQAQHAIELQKIVMEFPMLEQQLIEVASRAELVRSKMQAASKVSDAAEREVAPLVKEQP